MAFKYKRRDEAAWEKRANQQGGDYIGVIREEFKTFTPAKGDNYIRVLPPTWDDAEHYGMDIYVHYGIGPDRGSVLCLNKMKGQKCPICEAQIRAERSHDEELAKELKPNKRVLVYVLDRKDEKLGPMTWAMSWTLDREFVKVAKDRDGAIYMIDDPEDGYNVSFERTGEGIGTKYVGVKIDRKPSSIPQDVIDLIVLEPLPETLRWHTYDEIKKIYEGGASADDEDEKPKARAHEPEPDKAERPKPRGRARDDDDSPKPSTRAREEPGEDPPFERDPPQSRARDPEPEEGLREPEDTRAREPKPEPASSSGSDPKSRAAALREKFKNR